MSNNQSSTKKESSSKGFFSKFFPFFSKKQAEVIQKKPEHISYSKHTVETGTMVLSLDDVLKPHAELLKHTKRISGHAYENGKYTFETLFLPVIHSYTRYIHLLPASSGWHHARVGGLISHSLQVANRSLRIAKESHLTANQKLDVERNRTPRWQYAAWVAGLIHDAGKIYTDIKVTNAANELEVWHPLVSDLLAWAEQKNISRYYVTWRKDRIHKKHEATALAILHTILPDTAKEYISECPDDLHAALTDCLTGYSHNDGYLQSAVRRADSLSTSQDIRQVWDLELGPREAELFEKVIKAMQEMADTWLMEERIQILNDELFIEWPSCINDVQQMLTDAQQKTLSANALLEHLIERHIIRGLDGEKYAQFYKGVTTTQECLDIIIGKNNVRFQNLLRVEWPYHVLGEQAIPQNNSGLLTLNKEGRSVIFTEDDLHLISEDDVEKYEYPEPQPNSPQKDDNEECHEEGADPVCKNEGAYSKTQTRTKNTKINTEIDTTSNNTEEKPKNKKIKPKNDNKNTEKKVQIKIQPKKNIVPSDNDNILGNVLIANPLKQKDVIPHTQSETSSSVKIVLDIINAKSIEVIKKYKDEYYLLESDALDVWDDASGWSILNESNCLDKNYTDPLSIVQSNQISRKKLRSVKLNTDFVAQIKDSFSGSKGTQSDSTKLVKAKVEPNTKPKKESDTSADISLKKAKSPSTKPVKNEIINDNKQLERFVRTVIKPKLEADNVPDSYECVLAFLGRLDKEHYKLSDSEMVFEQDVLFDHIKNEVDEKTTMLITSLGDYDLKTQEITIK